MKCDENISKAQMIYITMNVLLGPAIITFTGLGYAKKDTFICDIIGLLVGLLLVFMMTYIVDNFPNMEFTQILDTLFNPFGGRIIALIYLIFAGSLLLLMENNIGGLVVNMVSPDTPLEVIVTTMTFVSAYIIANGIDKFSLNVELFTPILIILLIAIYVTSAIENGDIHNLLPFFTKDAVTLSKGVIDIVSFPYIDSCVLIFIYSVSKQKFKKSKPAYIGYLCVAPFLILRSLLVISVLGEYNAVRVTYPLYEVARLIKIGRYIERLESVVLIVWVLTTYIKLTVFYYATLKCIEYIFNLRDYRKLSFALAVFLIPLSLNVVTGIEDVLSYAYIPPTKVPVLILTILIFIRAKMKKSRLAKT